jgi:hypothetical protein
MQFTNPNLRGQHVPSSQYDFIGHDFNNRCTRSYNSDGHLVREPDAQFQPPIQLHIDSSSRDALAYPDPATFRIKLPCTLKGVYSIETVSVNYPNPTTPPVADRYLWLLNGLYSSGDFRAQPDLQGGIFRGALSTDLTAGAGSSSKADYAFAKLNFDLTLPAQLWMRHDYRQIKFYKPMIGDLNCLELTLANPDGTPVTLPDDTNWSVVLEVVLKQG